MTSFSDAVKVWMKIGFLSFGGPAGQIALMHREFVEERKWLDEKEYLSALNFCMLLPGPEAMQLATYMGWKMFGVRGGLAAGLLFVLPGALVVLALSILYERFGKLPLVEALFYGVKAAVLAIVLEALLRVARRALKSNADWVIAALSFLLLFVFDAPFPLIILAAATYGFVRARDITSTDLPPLPPIRAFGVTVALWAGVWLVPLGVLLLTLGQGHVLADLAVFFSKLAVVTFGGAYAVLSYMSQAAVEQKAWLTAPEMIDGLGLAETTPGPLILVTEFVGYIAAYRQLGFWGGLAGAAITLWMTFTPCFLFIFAGAPYISAITARPRLQGALRAITAAVVGVIFNLSLWFGLHVLFATVSRGNGWTKPWLPVWSSLDIWALTLSFIAMVVLLRLHAGVITTLLLSAALGVIVKLYVMHGSIL